MTDERERDMAAGKLDGRLTAFEARFTTYETASNARFDRLEVGQDQILAAVNQRVGMEKLIKLALVPLAAAFGWFLSHFFPNIFGKGP
jgi:hypothetical protein